MKLIIKSLIVAVLLVLPASQPNTLGYQADPDTTLLGRRLKRVEVRKPNMHLALSHLAKIYHIPIGLEVAQGGNSGPDIYLTAKDATVKEVLDAIVAKDARYEWDTLNGVINVTPRSARDVLLKELLDVKITEFKVDQGTNLLNLREQITNQAQVKQALDRAGVLANIAAYGNADTAPLGKFALTVNDKSLRDLLNEIVKTSDHKYWVLNRDGSRGEFLILNF